MNEKSRIGGVLSIVAGGFGVLIGIGLVALTFVLEMLFNLPSFAAVPMPDEFMWILRLMYGGMGVFYALIGALSIVGGIMALQRKHWGLALAGAIAGSVTFYPAGIIAIIFVSMAQPEFASASPSVTAPQA